MHSTRMGSISPATSPNHPITPHPTPRSMIDLHQGEIFRPIDFTQPEVPTPASKKTNHRSILDHSPDIILRIGAAGCLLDANPRSEEILGTKPEFLIGKNCREIGLPEAM